jgi:chromosome segregation ATPase
MDDRTLAFARDLERRDEVLATAIDDVAALLSETEVLRARAEDVQATLSRFPAEEQEAAALVARVRDELERRRGELGRAEHELEAASRSGDHDREQAARRAVERARDGVSLTQDRLARAEEELAGVRRQAEAARSEVPELEERARRLAERLRAVPRLSHQGGEPPSAALEGVFEWCSRARAALWVVRGGLETERERVVREANELAAGAFGEPLAATSVARVRERLEKA